jgi:hypothetical protein
MASPKCHIDFTHAERRVTRSSAAQQLVLLGGPWLPRQDVNDRLTIYGFKPGYDICWDQHGERRPQVVNQHGGGVEQMIHNILISVITQGRCPTHVTLR